MNGALSNFAITAGSIGTAASHGVSRTPASMSRSIQTYVPFFLPEGDSIPAKSAGSHAGSEKGVRVRSHVALIPPNPKTVEEPWWSETTRPLTWSLAQYAGSRAAGIVPSRHPARVEGGGIPAKPLARRRPPQRASAAYRLQARRPPRLRRRKNPTPADNNRATNHAFGWMPSRARSRNFLPEAEKDMRTARGTKYRRPMTGTRNEVPGTTKTTVTTPITKSVTKAVPHAAAEGPSRGKAGRYRHASRALPAISPASAATPTAKPTKRSHQGWMSTSGRIDSRNAVA